MESGKCLHFVSTWIKPTSTILVEAKEFNMPSCPAELSRAPRVDNCCVNDALEGLAVSRMAGEVGASILV